MINYPKKHELDGIYFRVQRNGKWENVCYTDLTEAEAKEKTKDKDVEWFKELARLLAMRLREIGDEFNLIRR